MRKNTVHWIYLLIFGLMLFNSCDDNDYDSCVDATGPVVTDTRDLGNFHSIFMEGVGNIWLTQGPLEPVVIEAQEEVMELLDTRVSNGILRIDIDGCLRGINRDIDIYITIPDISKIRLSGVGNVVVENDLDVDDLFIEVSGVGNITLLGEAEYLEINSSGVGNVYAFNMPVDICKVFISGTGFIEVDVMSVLDVTITGSANVYYRGNPRVSTNISGTGNVINVE